jgi:hypothetical protein
MRNEFGGVGEAEGFCGNACGSAETFPSREGTGLWGVGEEGLRHRARSCRGMRAAGGGEAPWWLVAVGGGRAP